MKQLKNGVVKTTLLTFIFLALLGLSVYQYIDSTKINSDSNQIVNPYGKEFVPVKGQIQVFIDGKLVYKDHNVIHIRFYDALGCKIWNISTSCIGGIILKTSSNTALDSMVLSSFTTGPISPVETTCPNQIAAAGLSAKKADTVTQVVDTNSMVLTTTWVNTSGSTVNPIGRVCLLVRDNIGIDVTFMFASATFTPQSLGNGQSITIQWTYSF